MIKRENAIWWNVLYSDLFILLSNKWLDISMEYINLANACRFILTEVSWKTEKTIVICLNIDALQETQG